MCGFQRALRISNFSQNHFRFFEGNSLNYVAKRKHAQKQFMTLEKGSKTKDLSDVVNNSKEEEPRH